jgi:hypothetical protein
MDFVDSVADPIRHFFQRFETSSAGGDVPALTALFAEVFLAAVPDGARPVKASDFALALPKRFELFHRLGCISTELTGLEAKPLSARFTLAETTWRMVFASEGRDAIAVDADSTYIVDTSADPFRIVLYLPKEDITAVLRARGILTSDQT